MANLLQFNSPQIECQHQNSIVASLNRRLEVARAANNTQLLELLEQERRQLSLGASQVAWLQQLGHQMSCFWAGIRQLIAPTCTLRVERVVDAAGEEWWYAYNVQTGESVYADSDVELNLWLETHYQGR